MSDDGNGIIALAQENNEAFHSQEIAMRAPIRMRLFMLCCKIWQHHNREFSLIHFATAGHVP